ncbi:MAG: DUF1684 domain-containing protein [Hymenobacteraceae bacterium]|nr:DUF1684 domain-containing protein [Hymenobacteraceae bacterium]MDX5394741.1 DUF1684 domain-containing protein [Hymenobacteraceae bacterium]MDX5510774.1 DUF1684 domain-containing protein [Hymenobacteraceae bacterium]
MKPIKLIILIGVAGILFYLFKDLIFSDENYKKLVQQERDKKDLSFRSRTNSPLEDNARATFTKLNYYEPDKDYQVSARYEEFADPDTVQMQMTNETTEPYLRYAKATFELEGQEQQLTLFKKVNETEETLFVPFTDKTNGFDTYGGGRYVDVPYGKNGKVTLDFNEAYNPYCAYNPEYSCPVPPSENFLSVAIPAGEKAFSK